MAINKILDKNKNVILDLTADTVDSTHLAAGYTAHNKHGQIIVGTLEQKDYVVRGEPVVIFYDWYGKELYKYTKAEFMALEELPPLPEFSDEIKQYYRNTYRNHSYTSSYFSGGQLWPIIYFLDNIVVDRWSDTLEDLKKALSSGMDGAQVAPLYKMKDDCTRIVCINNNSTDNSYTSFTINFSQSVANGVEIDWGDGTAPETFEEFGNTNIAATHNYSWYGKIYDPYIITLKVIEGTMGFGYRQPRDWSTNEYISESAYGTPYISSSNTYHTSCIFFGKNVELGYVYGSSQSWGVITNIFGGLHEISFDKVTSYYATASDLYHYYCQPTLVATSNIVSRQDGVAPIYFSKYSTGRVIIPVSSEKPANIVKNYGWVTPSSSSSGINYLGDKIYLPLSWTEGAWIRPSVASYNPKYIYPPNFKPKALYACSNQGDVFTQAKIVGYIQDGLEKTATYCFAYTPSLVDFTCAYNADYPELPSYTFSYCPNLAAIRFEEGTKKIPKGLCYSCNKLKYVYIPASVDTIESSAFVESHPEIVIEMDPALSGRTYNGTWLNTSTSAKIYYNGTWENWITEMLYGEQPANYQGLSYITYVLNEEGTEEYNGKKYKRLLEEAIPSTFTLPIGKDKVSLSWLSYFPNIKDLHILPVGLSTITQMPSFTTCCLNGVYFDGPLTQWLQLNFSNRESQSSNPMSCAEHLYVLDVSGTVIKDGKTYSEVTEIIAPTYMSSNGVAVKAYCLHGYNGGVHKIIIPEGVVRVESDAIKYNNAITHISLPESLISLGYRALAYNYRLCEITLPKNLTSIDGYCFENCYNLYKVTLKQSEFPSVSNGAFRYCYHLYEIENHTTTNLNSYKGTTSKGYLCNYAKNIITDETSTQLSVDENNNVLLQSGSNVYFAGYKGTDGLCVYPVTVTTVSESSYNRTIYLDNNVKKLIFPDAVNYTLPNYNSGYPDFRNYYHVDELELGTMFKTTGPFSFGSLCLNRVVKNSNSYSPFYRYSFGKEYYTFELGEEFIIGQNTTTLSQALTTEPLGVKNIVLEPSNNSLNWNTYLNYNTLASIEAPEIDFSTRPLSFTYSGWLISQNYSDQFKEDLKLKTLKLNCGSNLYSGSYGILSFAQDIERLVLTGTGMTALDGYLLRGEMPNLKEVVLPASLKTIKGTFLAQFPIDHPFSLTCVTTTPPTISSDLMSKSNIIRPQNLTIRVPQGSLEAYSTATNWPTIDQVNYVEYDPVTGENIIKGE